MLGRITPCSSIMVTSSAIIFFCSSLYLLGPHATGRVVVVFISCSSTLVCPIRSPSHKSTYSIIISRSFFKFSSSKLVCSALLHEFPRLVVCAHRTLASRSDTNCLPVVSSRPSATAFSCKNGIPSNSSCELGSTIPSTLISLPSGSHALTTPVSAASIRAPPHASNSHGEFLDSRGL